MKATVLLPSPREGEGLGERGQMAQSAGLDMRSTLPLSPTLSLRGRGSEAGTHA